MTASFQGRRPRRAAPVSALCALVAFMGAGLAGCSGDPDAGTNGVGRLPADQIQARTRAAADSTDAVHLSGKVVGNGRTYRLDMRLTSDGGSGSVISQGVTFRLLRIGRQLYVRAGADFWSHAGGGRDAGAAHELDGKFVKVPQGDPSYQRFSGFTDKDVLLDGLLTLHGTLARDGYHRQGGVRTIRITGGDDGRGGALDVSLEGTPYPLRLERAGGAGTLVFSEWGEDVALTAPDRSDTVDYGKRLPAS